MPAPTIDVATFDALKEATGAEFAPRDARAVVQRLVAAIDGIGLRVLVDDPAMELGHARRLIGWKTSWPAMTKTPMDTAVLLTRLAALFFVPMSRLVVLRLGREEAMMIGAFGDAYREYMNTTGRLLPKWLLRTPP